MGKGLRRYIVLVSVQSCVLCHVCVPIRHAKCRVKSSSSQVKSIMMLCLAMRRALRRPPSTQESKLRPQPLPSQYNTYLPVRKRSRWVHWYTVKSYFLSLIHWHVVNVAYVVTVDIVEEKLLLRLPVHGDLAYARTGTSAHARARADDTHAHAHALLTSPHPMQCNTRYGPTISISYSIAIAISNAISK